MFSVLFGRVGNHGGGRDCGHQVLQISDQVCRYVSDHAAFRSQMELVAVSGWRPLASDLFFGRVVAVE